MVKTVLFPLLILSYIMAVACFGRSPTTFPAWPHLADEAVDIIQHYDSFHSFLVTINKQPDQESIAGKYGILDEGPELSQENICALQHYVLNEDNFRFSPIKKFLFIPEYAFKFTKGGDTVTILVSLSYQQIEFLYKATSRRGDFEKSVTSLETIIKENLK